MRLIDDLIRLACLRRFRPLPNTAMAVAVRLIDFVVISSASAENPYRPLAGAAGFCPCLRCWKCAGHRRADAGGCD